MTKEELVAARTALNLSRRDLANLLGVHWNTVTKWETGGQNMPPYLGLALDGIRLRSIRAIVADVEHDFPLQTFATPSSVTLPDSQDDSGTWIDIAAHLRRQASLSQPSPSLSRRGRKSRQNSGQPARAD
jgi:DNA-binding XRE family transcriptional regulator